MVDYQFLVDLHYKVVHKSYPVDPITWRKEVHKRFKHFYQVGNSKSNMQLQLFRFQTALDHFRMMVSRDGGGHITQMFTGMVEDLLATKWRFVDCMGPNRFKLDGPTQVEDPYGRYSDAFLVMEWNGNVLDTLLYNTCSGELKTRSGIAPESIDCQLPKYIETSL